MPRWTKMRRTASPVKFRYAWPAINKLTKQCFQCLQPLFFFLTPFLISHYSFLLSVIYLQSSSPKNPWQHSMTCLNGLFKTTTIGQETMFLMVIKSINLNKKPTTSYTLVKILTWMVDSNIFSNFFFNSPLVCCFLIYFTGSWESKHNKF